MGKVKFYFDDHSMSEIYDGLGELVDTADIFFMEQGDKEGREETDSMWERVSDGSLLPEVAALEYSIYADKIKSLANCLYGKKKKVETD